MKIRASIRQVCERKTIKIQKGSKLNLTRGHRNGDRLRPNINGHLRNQGDNFFGLRDQLVEGLSGEEPHERRRLAALGIKSVLAIRVTDGSDVTTGSSLSEISNFIFGTSGDTVNLKSQYDACSQGKLLFEPFNGLTTTNVPISDGVVNVTIPESVNGVSRYTAEDYVMDAAGVLLGNLPNQFDHVMLCIPPGTSGNWIAYAYINSWLSVYNDDWCNYVSGQMHEIGMCWLAAHSVPAIMNVAFVAYCICPLLFLFRQPSQDTTLVCTFLN